MSSPVDIQDEDLLLQRAYRNAETLGDRPYMTQPMGGGKLDVFSWVRTFDEAKRVAAYLRSLELAPGSQIAILSKNCAHFILADLAIWMAGHVSVAIYPTLDADTVEYILAHSESKLIFIGKLDDLDTMEPGIPDDLPGCACPSPRRARRASPGPSCSPSTSPSRTRPPAGLRSSR